MTTRLSSSMFRLPENLTQHRGAVTESLAELVDGLPTLCEAADIPESAAGLSLIPILEDPEVSLCNFALAQSPPPGKTMAYSIRTPGWRYHETFLGDHLDSMIGEHGLSVSFRVRQTVKPLADEFTIRQANFFN